MADSFDKAKNCMKGGCFIEIMAIVLSCSLAKQTENMSFFERMDYYNNNSVVYFGSILCIIGVLLIIIGAIWWTGAAASKTADVAAGLAAELIEYTINKVIDAFSVKEEVKKRCPNALKMQILEKKKNAVNVGIFNDATTMSQKISIQSNQGVSDSIHVGQVIYLNN